MNNWKKVQFFCILGILVFPSIQAAISDTVFLDKVVAQGIRFGTITTGAKYYKIDSFTFKTFQSASLADLLQQQSLIAVKTHGPGGLATISVRGGSSRHTAIIWNGFSLRNPMSGGMNFSALPVGFIDEVSIQPGGSSTMYGSGAASGIIFLGNKLYLKNSGWKSSANTEIASFGNYHGIISAGYQGKNFASQLKLGYQVGENDFRFKNTDKFNNPFDTLKHASFNRKSVIHQTLLKIGANGELQSDIWYVRYLKNIPSLTSDYEESSAFQQDDNIRIALNYSTYWDKILIKLRSGFLYDKIYYYDDAGSGIETNNICRSFINEAEVKFSVNPMHTAFAGINHTSEHASSEGYLSDTSRIRYALFGRYNLAILKNKIQFSFEGRQELVGSDLLPFVFSFGNNITIMPRLHLKGIAAKHFALPIMDDLFWKEDGFAYGNPDLKPEYGWNYEAGSDYEFITPSGAVKNEITFYYHHTYDLILWQPNGEDGKWTPINVNESKSRGVEYMGESKFIIPNGLIQIRYMYSYTHAKIYDAGTNSVSQQRPFVPKHNANMSAAITFRSYNLQYIHSFFGRSFYDDLHTIDQYSLGTLYFGYAFNCSFICINTYLKINNIFNVTYKVMPGYAQPPRNFAMGINFKF